MPPLLMSLCRALKGKVLARETIQFGFIANLAFADLRGTSVAVHTRRVAVITHGRLPKGKFVQMSETMSWILIGFGLQGHHC